MLKNQLAIVLLGTLVACQNPMPTPFVSPVVSPLDSPLAASSGPLVGPNFEVSTIRAGDQTVSGRGPVDMPIIIVDVSLSAKPLGSGTIDGKGEFTLDLSEPAIVGHLIGIQVIDLAGSPYQPTDEFVKQLDAKGGPGFRYYPQIGAVYASTQVKP